MRLINTDTLRIEDFDKEGGLQYAILSHRWESEEVTLQDMESGDAQTKAGYDKIRNCCSLAKRDGLPYAWVDTCCIDKKSSAELTEAINSMYRWYQNAEVCYAFLSDVEDTGDHVPPSFATSQWFLRGWTLQELLAPKVVKFYDCSWGFIGTKGHLTDVISHVTKISRDILQGASVRSYSIAQRMSWAANRKTTRAEDRAYSLLGLFDVNMPLLYGEGERAFLRLQEEIIRQSDDHSIFVWSLASLNNYPGLLAPTPDAFANSSGVESRESGRERSSYAMTNRGLSITLLLTPWAADTYLALLDCVCPTSDRGVTREMGIFLRRLKQDDQYAKTTLKSRHYDLFELEWRPRQVVTINVRQNSLFAKDVTPFQDSIYGYRLNLNWAVPSMEIARLDDLVDIPRNNTWSPGRNIIRMREGSYGTAGVLNLGSLDKDLRELKLGFDFDHNPAIYVTERKVLEYRVQYYTTPRHVEEKRSYGPSDCWNDKGWLTALPLRNPLVFTRGQKRVWAIRGNRRTGLGLEFTAKSRLCTVQINIRRGTFEDKGIWDVNISGLEPPSPVGQRLRKLFKRK